mgnify:CR=1 FL=1
MYPAVTRSPAERKLERALQKADIKFQKNIRIDGHEVDFLTEWWVVIEVDGYVHCQRDVREKDKRKTEYLTSRGYAVLRFKNHDIYYRLKDCVTQVKQMIKSQHNRWKTKPLDVCVEPWKRELHTLRRKMLEN